MTFYEYIILVLLSINFYSSKVLMAISYGPKLINKLFKQIIQKTLNQNYFKSYYYF